MLAESGLPFSFWGHCLASMVHVWNRLPTASLPNTTPFEPSISANQMSLTSGFGDAQPMFIFRKISATSSNHMLRSVSSLDIPLVIKAGCSTIPLLAKLTSVNELNLMRDTSHVYLAVNKTQSLSLHFIHHQLPLFNPIQLHHLLDHHHSQMKRAMTTCLLNQL